MITVPELRTALLDLLHETRETDLGLIIGGGFGLYLKAEHIRRLSARTLLREWPSPRSTNDLDLFLRPELSAWECFGCGKVLTAGRTCN